MTNPAGALYTKIDFWVGVAHDAPALTFGQFMNIHDTGHLEDCLREPLRHYLEYWTQAHIKGVRPAMENRAWEIYTRRVTQPLTRSRGKTYAQPGFPTVRIEPLSDRVVVSARARHLAKEWCDGSPDFHMSESDIPWAAEEFAVLLEAGASGDEVRAQFPRYWKLCVDGWDDQMRELFVRVP